MKNIFLTLGILLLCYSTFAQEDKPKSYVDEGGKLYWNKSVPAYFWIGSSPDKPEHKLESQSTPEYANPHYFDTEGINFIRSRDAFDPETQRIVEPRIEVLYELYVDGIAPTSQLSLENAMLYKNATANYFGPGLEVHLSARDAVSGVENIFITINDQPKQVFDSPVKIQKEGEYTLQYYAMDKVGNSEQSREENLILDISAPVSDLNINGILDGNVISSGSRLYILSKDNLSGVKTTYLKFDDEDFKVYDNKDINFKVLPEGNHTLTYYSVDQVGNKEQEKSLKFYFDKSGPLMAADVLGDRFVVGDQVYFSGRTKLKLTAVDNKVGVKEIRYSIDGSEYLQYDQPFYLPSVSGEHSVRYYSIDNMDNRSTGSGEAGFEEFKHSVSKVYVDLTGPTLSHSVLGNSVVRKDTLLIGPNNSIKIIASDKESGLKGIFYSLNRETRENPYENPIVFTEEGTQQLEYIAYDNVNNRNIADIVFNVDTTPPNIFFQLTVGSIGEKDGMNIYPASASLFIVGTDEKAGLKQIFYSLNEQSEKSYTNIISGMKKGVNTIKARAIDNLGNESTDSISFIIQ